jgi:hypothetical protein
MMSLSVIWSEIRGYLPCLRKKDPSPSRMPAMYAKLGFIVAMQPLAPRKLVVIYVQDSNGDWRSNIVTAVQGGTATVATATTTDANGGLMARKEAVRAANPNAIHSEHVVETDYA